MHLIANFQENANFLLIPSFKLGKIMTKAVVQRFKHYK